MWSKAPLRMFHYPGLFLAIALGALLLALAASAYPLFISSSASELVTTRIDDPLITRWGAGMLYRNLLPLPGGRSGDDSEEAIDRAFGDLTATSPYLSPPVMSALGPLVDVAPSDRLSESRQAYLFTGEGADKHVRIVEGSAGSGALVPEPVADALELAPGDEIVLGPSNGVESRIRVDGVFRPLYESDPSGFWTPWVDEIATSLCQDPARTDSCVPPPQPLIVDRDRFLEVAAAMRIHDARFAWIAPVSGDLDLQEAEDASARASEISERITARPLFDPCSGQSFGSCRSRSERVLQTQIGVVVRDVHRRIAVIQGPSRVLRTAGVLVALAVVAGAGTFATAARRVESALLFARGARPSGVGGRAAVEAALPSVIGAAAGLGLALLFVPALGPGGAIADEARSQAIRATIAAGAASVLAIGVVSVAAFLRQSDHRSRSALLTNLPWELALIALSIVALVRLRNGGAVVVDEALDTRSPSDLLLLFPVLFLAGFVLLLARVAVLAVRSARRRSGRLPQAPYLAVHRLGARPRLSMVMVAAAGLCLGLFVQAQTIARSTGATVEATAGVYVGSDVQVRIDHINTTPDGFPLPLTRVVRELEAGEFSANRPFDMLAVDGATFARAAFWDPLFAGEPLESLVDRLRDPAAGRLPILLAGGAGIDPTSVTIDTRTVPVEVVGLADTFPGMSSYRPLVVVDQQRLLDAFEGQASPLNHTSSSHELWIRGPTAAALAAVQHLPFTPELVVTAEEVKDIPYIAAVIDSFLVMKGLAVLAAMLVLAAILMYLQARQRAEVVSYGLSLRMGMRPAGHLGAIALEVGAILALALVVGSALAVAAARLVVPMLDPLEAIPPDPFTVVPVATIAAIVPLLMLAALAGAWLTERRARSADLGQVMRLAE